MVINVKSGRLCDLCGHLNVTLVIYMTLVIYVVGWVIYGPCALCTFPNVPYHAITLHFDEECALWFDVVPMNGV